MKKIIYLLAFAAFTCRADFDFCERVASAAQKWLAKIPLLSPRDNKYSSQVPTIPAVGDPSRHAFAEALLYGRISMNFRDYKQFVFQNQSLILEAIPQITHPIAPKLISSLAQGTYRIFGPPSYDVLSSAPELPFEIAFLLNDDTWLMVIGEKHEVNYPQAFGAMNFKISIHSHDGLDRRSTYPSVYDLEHLKDHRKHYVACYLGIFSYEHRSTNHDFNTRPIERFERWKTQNAHRRMTSEDFYETFVHEVYDYKLIRWSDYTGIAELLRYFSLSHHGA
jgi:hypothetical protein